MSTTVRIYKSSFVDARLKVRYGRKHGRPRGRGKRTYRLLYRETVNWGALDA